MAFKMQAMTTLSRHATQTVLSRLSAFRVVVVSGARQVGKSTLARLVLKKMRGRYLTLDDPLTLSRASEDPDGLIAGGGLTVIDEVQRLPELLLSVKRSVDRDPAPGRFLLTGSANLLAMRRTGETLAGRAAWLDLLPMSWSEIERRPSPRTIEDAFRAGDAEAFLSTLAPARPDAGMRARIRALSGGMPEAFPMDAENRRAWYESYRRTFLERDLRMLSGIGSLPEFGRVMSLALLRTANLLTKSHLAADARVSHTTVDRYLGVLETACQIRLLHPFFPNVAKRLVKSPKIFAVDGGAAAWAANAWDWAGAVAAGKDGALLETFILSDILSWDGLTGTSRHHFWRTGAGAEVDLVIERGEQVVGIEVKSAATLRHADAAGLRALRGDLGKRFHLGILAYLGEELRPIDDRIVAVPVASLLGVK